MIAIISLLFSSVVLLPIYLISSEKNQKRIEDICNKEVEGVIEKYESKYSIK